MRAAFYRLAKAFMSYRHPLWLATQRLSGRRLVRFEDEATRLKFACRRGADSMFGDTFHARVYDVPTAPVRHGDLVIDVGANHGFATCLFAHRGANVVAFEPSPEVFRLLVANVEANGLVTAVTATQAAVGVRDGVGQLLETSALGGGMSTLSPAFAATSGVAYPRATEVEVRSIGSVLASLAPRRVRLLKLDCEGSELDLLAVLTPDERARIDSIALEYHANAYPLRDLAELLLGWQGFHVAKVTTLDTPNANLQIVQTAAIRAWADEGG